MSAASLGSSNWGWYRGGLDVVSSTEHTNSRGCMCVHAQEYGICHFHSNRQLKSIHNQCTSAVWNGCAHARVCVCACMCVQVLACAYMYLHVCTCVCMCVQVFACAYMCLHVRTCVCMCVHVLACAYMCLHCVCVCGRDTSYLRSRERSASGLVLCWRLAASFLSHRSLRTKPTSPPSGCHSWAQTREPGFGSYSPSVLRSWRHSLQFRQPSLNTCRRHPSLPTPVCTSRYHPPKGWQVDVWHGLYDWRLFLLCIKHSGRDTCLRWS